MARLDTLRNSLRTAAPNICPAIFDHLAPNLIPTPPIASPAAPLDTKYLNDPIWKIISLTALEATIIDLPLMQRLRRVRQLGLAHMVYTSANHSRLEHSIGAIKAAQKMFDSLAESAGMHSDFRRQSRQFVSLAALTHDCGHTVFSHVGERVLQRLYSSEFELIEQTLYKHYPDPVSLQSKPRSRNVWQKLPPASELISALLVLSEPFQNLLSTLTLELSTEKTILNACGLIIGRPFDMVHSNHFYHFLKNIVSGDLDADKIDYVARDAYFAGLPVSADVHRLLSQLTVATVSNSTKLDNIQLPFGGGKPDYYHLLAIRPSAASALEMFVMTRSYLFERIYGHHKIRAAERMLERLLWQRINYSIIKKEWTCNNVLDFLFDVRGDDYVLGNLTVDVDDEKIRFYSPKEGCNPITAINIR